MLRIFVDADGCPVKDEVYRVAQRYDLSVTVVANSIIHVPEHPWIERVLVRGTLDAADHWIATHAGANDIVITSDIPLASRCLDNSARVLDPRGREFSPATIGEALAQRELMSQLRDRGLVSGGPAAFDKRDRSRFLQQLDAVIQSIRRSSGGEPQKT